MYNKTSYFITTRQHDKITETKAKYLASVLGLYSFENIGITKNRRHWRRQRRNPLSAEIHN